MTFFSNFTNTTRFQSEVEAGNAYNLSGVFTAVTVVNILLDNTGNAKDIHAVFATDVDQDGTMELFEDTTVSANGNALPIAQLNRPLVANTPGLSAFEGPTITLDGTLLRQVFVPSGAGGGGGGVGAAEGLPRGGEWILSNKIYLIRVTISASGTIGGDFTFFEI